MKKLIILILSIISFAAIAQTNDASLKSESNSNIRLSTASQNKTATVIDHVIENKVNLVGGVVATGTDTYAATVSTITAYSTGLTVDVNFTNGNSGASTLNLNSIGATSIRKNVSGTLTALSSGDISAGQPLRLFYDGTYFVIEGATSSGGGGDLLSTNNLSDVASAATSRANLGAADKLQQKTVSTTTYSIVDADNNYVIYFTNASGCTVTLPNTITTDKIFNFVRDTGAGTITFASDGTSTLTSVSSAVTIDVVGGWASWVKKSSTAFYGTGALGSGGTGTVTSVASADGSVTVTSPTTAADLAVVKSPKLTTGRTIAITGDLAYTSPSFDGSGNVTAAGTLATVNSNVGTFGSATTSLTTTVNAKGLITAISSQTVTPAVGSITGLGTGVATWLGTPSWTNFNSAITGTAPYWALTGTSTLTGAATISSTAANRLSFTNAWTNTASGQWGTNFTGTITARATASDQVYHTLYDPTFVTGANNQQLQLFRALPTFTLGANTGTLIIGYDWAPTITGTPGTHIGFRSVSGNVLIGNSTITSSTTLDVQGLTTGNVARFASTTNVSLLRVDNGGEVRFGTSASPYITSGSYGTPSTGGNGLVYTADAVGGHYFRVSANGLFTANPYYNFANVTGAIIVPTAGVVGSFFKIGASMTNSGSATGSAFSYLNIVPNLNLTTGTTTIIGIDYNPTETSMVGTTHYGILQRSTTALSGFGTATPNSTLSVSGSLSLAYVAKTSSYTLTALDYLVNFTTGTCTATLPTAVGITGRVYVIKNTGATLTLATTSSQTVDGTTPGVVATFTRVMSDGANWITF